MLTEQDFAYAGRVAATSGLRPGLGMLAAALRSVLRRYRMRAVLRDLSEREDYLLADIGISREWLDRALTASVASRAPQLPTRCGAAPDVCGQFPATEQPRPSKCSRTDHDLSRHCEEGAH